MEAYAITDTGKTRQINQDFVYCSSSPIGILPNLYVVADGMGGHSAGDYASRFCVEEFIRRIEHDGAETIISGIDCALEKTNQALLQKASESPELEGMGTTFVAACIQEDTMYVVNIGDSRLYLIDDSIKQITRDHSLVEEMIQNGDLMRSEARFHPKKNVITRAVGTNNRLELDFFEVTLQNQDIVLLCSDGLSNMVDDAELYRIVAEGKEDLAQTLQELVKKANENGGKDNISAILVRK